MKDMLKSKKVLKIEKTAKKLKILNCRIRLMIKLYRDKYEEE